MTDASKIAFITCVNDEEKYGECLLYLRHLRIPDGMEAEYIPVRGAASMAAGYNAAMRSSKARYKVYLHQDVLVVNKDFVRAVRNIFEDETIGMIGVVGCRSLPASGIWWDGMRCYGRVLHACEPESVVDSEMQEPEGPYMEVEAADGLLLATHYDIFTIRHSAWSLAVGEKKSSCRIKRRTFGASIVRGKNRWLRITGNGKGFFCGNTARSFRRKYDRRSCDGKEGGTWRRTSRRRAAHGQYLPLI